MMKTVFQIISVFMINDTGIYYSILPAGHEEILEIKSKK